MLSTARPTSGSTLSTSRLARIRRPHPFSPLATISSFKVLFRSQLRQRLSSRLRHAPSVNSARYFIRREDDEPPRTPPESPFRRFDAKCLKCQSYQLSLATEFDEQSGELSLVLTCRRCRQQEKLLAR